MTRSVVIIGAGPAGLSAAARALDRGASVTLLDAADELGGQYWRHPPTTADGPTDRRLQHGWNTFSRLRDTFGTRECSLTVKSWVVALERSGS